MKQYCIILMVLLGFCSACKKEPRGQYPVDSVPPGAIKSPQVKNIAGGAIITYVLPGDEDLLYVKATYKLGNGTAMEEKASVYAHSIEVEGFGKSQPSTVQLIAYDRSNNASKPVTVDIHPLDAPIYSIFKSLKVYDDFGGVRLEWDNPDAAKVVIEVDTLNEKGGMVNAQNIYTDAKIGTGNVRGYTDSVQVFGMSVRDRWGNHTDTLIGTYHPLYEVELDKSKFAVWNPPGLTTSQLGGWGLPNAWNGTIAGNGFSTGVGHYAPQDITFDMGQLAKLSRFVINSRDRAQHDLIYSYGHFKRFSLWGSPTPNVNQDTSTWIKIGDFESHKPSGLPVGQVTEEDIETAVIKGEDYVVDPHVPPVRYIWIRVEETWGGATPQMMEITFYGDPRH